ncbi:hypothetical protein FXO38_05717 [Capsicum annuum]|nr:hypothetical protein FXO38_05717 [Capsicum annuum]
MSSARPSSFQPSKEVETSVLEEEINHRKFQGVDFSKTVPKVYYEAEALVDSDPGSPSPSKMRPKVYARKTSIDVLSTNDFVLDNKEVNWLSNLPKNQHKIERYKATYSRVQRVSFRNKWFADMIRFRTEVKFFQWFKYSGQIDDQKEFLKFLINNLYPRYHR